MNKLSKKKVASLLNSHILHEIKPGQGWGEFTGLNVVNKSDATIYFLYFTDMDVD